MPNTLETEFEWDEDYTPEVEDDLLDELSEMTWEEILEATEREEARYREQVA